MIDPCIGKLRRRRRYFREFGSKSKVPVNAALEQLKVARKSEIGKFHIRYRDKRVVECVGLIFI